MHSLFSAHCKQHDDIFNLNFQKQIFEKKDEILINILILFLQINYKEQE